ncbi:MAG: mannose-1-phosphate guanylyltransferase, partial [Oscillospiraceae bacterium]|nr:mannose-1-phosphate guanylyltransferase [Oscillospiraceae bacterium]
MNFILLSGGSGKRLWPLSNDVRSKQFIKIFKNEDGIYESMVQRVYRQINASAPNANITIATSKTQVSSIKNQLGNNVDICIEPCRRDTFPAIALAAMYLHDVKGISENDTVAVCPVDPYVEKEYFSTICKLQNEAKNNSADLMLMGIEPTHPSEKYGYIIPETSDKISTVKEFKEKPDVKNAEKYISDGALWNCGVFIFKLGYIVK